jgi:hypothetical protein
LGTQLGIKTSSIDELIIIILEINLFGSIKIRERDLWEHHLGTIINLIGTTFSCGWELSKICEG